MGERRKHRFSPWRRTALPWLLLVLAFAGSAPQPADGDEPPARLYGVEVEVFAIRATSTDASSARRALLALIERYRPPDRPPLRDLGAAYSALFSADLAPPDLTQALALAGGILRADPETSAAWPLCDRLRRIYATGARSATTSAPRIRRWIRDLGAELDGEAGRALSLLEAYLDFDEEKMPLARLGAARIAGARCSPELRKAADELFRRTGLLHRGAEAPPFRMPLADGSGQVSLDGLGGRAVLMLFDRGDAVAMSLRLVAESLLKVAPDHELSGVRVRFVDREVASAKAVSPRWLRVRPDAVNRKLAKHYGADGISALFLISADRTILMSTGWRASGGPERARGALRKALGVRTPELLARAAAGPGWAGFRDTVRRLRLRAKILDHPAIAAAAARAGPRGMLALILAGASEGLDLRRRLSGTDLRIRLGLAWADARLGGGEFRWGECTRALAAPDTGGCLDTVDALFDIGLAGERVRRVLRAPILRSNDWRTVSTALRCLQFQTTDEDPGAIVKRLEDERWQVRLALAEGLRAHRHKAAVDALIELLGDERRRVRVAAAGSLEDLTGRFLGPNQRAWSAWRREQGSRIVFPPRELTVESLSAEHGRSYGWEGFFDLKFESDRVVFLIDKSDSMSGALFGGVLSEMRAALESASPTTRFAVIEFAEKAVVFKHQLLPVNRRTIDQAVAYLCRAWPDDQGTNIMGALDLGLAVEEAGAVVLLSDGLPNRGRVTDVSRILTEVTRGNRYRRIAIHAVWMRWGRGFPHDGPRGEDRPPLGEEEIARRRAIREQAAKDRLGGFLSRLAASNGGTFAVAFCDYNRSPPGASFRENRDK